MYRATPVDNTEPCHRLSARNSRLSAPDALIGRVYAGGSSRWSERKRPVVAVPVTKPAPARATILRRLEEAAGVEAQFEAIQSTETPLEFLLRKMRDIRHRGFCHSLSWR